MLVTLVFQLLSASHRFLFELDGSAVGTVTLEVQGSRYRYIQTHGYRRTEREQRDEFELNGFPVPESYWLLNRHEVGCVESISELQRRRGQVCFTKVAGNEVEGTTFGRAFQARYDSRGELVELKIGMSRFLRSEQPFKPDKPYAAGFAIDGNGAALVLEPSATGVRWLRKAPQGIRTEPMENDDECLEVAKEYVRMTPSFRVVRGVVVDEGRAFPHAWVTDGKQDIDPTAERGAVSKNATYLEFPAEQAGALYVDLLEGRRRLLWR